MSDLNRHVVPKYAVYWYEIGIELRLKLHELDKIAEKNSQDCVSCLRKVLMWWLAVTDNPTWKILEVALANIRRLQLCLDPVDDVLGEGVL